MKKTGLLTILLSVACLVANAATDIPANDSRISYSGRICWRDSLSPAFSYPGVSATLQFTGQSIAMKAKPGSGYFMVEIDNRLPFKINFTESDSILTLAEGLPEGTHRLRVVYAIEGYDKKPEFRGFILPDGGTLETPPAKPNRRIEFIGNSITCGYGIEAESEKDDFSYATENHYYSYAAQTARNLNAEYVTVARSGYGVYRNYGGPIEGNPDCIPALYDRTLFYDPDVKWDFSEFRPDVVCVNLGTNDMSLNKCDTVRFEAAYRDFLSRLRAYYPEAKIVMLTGCLLTGELEKTNEAYALAKISGLKYCEFLNRQYGTDYISVMPTNLYGPNDNYHPEHSHVLPALIRRFHEAKEQGLPYVTCWGDGSPLREFLYVDDLANLCVFLMNNYSGNETVNAGTGKELTIKALTELVAKVVGYNGEIRWDTTRPNGTPRKLLDVSKATALGWTYKTELEDGIRLAYEDFLNNPMRAER